MLINEIKCRLLDIFWSVPVPVYGTSTKTLIQIITHPNSSHCL
jgi:hypothetical protein